MTSGEVKKDIPNIIFHTYALCKYTDMSDEMRQETIDVSITAAEKYADNYELAARTIKEDLDKKFGAPFDVVVGEAFGSAVTHQEKSLLYMFTGGNVAILVWRTVSAFG